MTDKLIFIVLLLYSSMAYTGGFYFPIQISEIVSYSKKDHHIKFTMLEKIGNESFSYPLDKCDTITLHISYQEWDKDNKIMSFLADLFTLYGNLRKSNKIIQKLKENINHQNRFLLSDVEAFAHHPNDNCLLYSKTLTISGELHGSFIKNHPDETLTLLQPTRHHSNIDNKFKK